MAGMSDYLELEILDHILGVGSYTAPTPYVALFTAAPSDAGGGTEVSGGSYARVNASSAFSAAASGASANTSPITFPTATASWGTVTHVGIYDASTSGNLLCWAALDASKVVGSGDVLAFSTGDLEITLD